jgi:hypothetical protein
MGHYIFNNDLYGYKKSDAGINRIGGRRDGGAVRSGKSFNRFKSICFTGPLLLDALLRLNKKGTPMTKTAKLIGVLLLFTMALETQAKPPRNVRIEPEVDWVINVNLPAIKSIQAIHGLSELSAIAVFHLKRAARVTDPTKSEAVRKLSSEFTALVRPFVVPEKDRRPLLEAMDTHSLDFDEAIVVLGLERALETEQAQFYATKLGEFAKAFFNVVPDWHDAP